jgi:hypothetical protein
MWDNPAVIVAIIMAGLAIIGQVVSVTIFVTRLGGKIDVNHTAVTGEIRLMSSRIGNVETGLTDLKNTDRRLSLVEDRQAALATRQGNMEQDNLLIREDLNKLHQGLDRHASTLARFNDAQFAK